MVSIYKGKKVHRFNFDKNRKNIARRKKSKEKRKQQLDGQTKEGKVLQKVWDERRSLQQNLASVGLSSDPNKSVPIQKTR